MIVQKIYKYPTGAKVPEMAIYLGTVTQTKIEDPSNSKDDFWSKCWLVWHYFLVEVEE